MPEIDAPLTGIRVLGFAETLPGPLAASILADLGAEVTMVERPVGGDPARVIPAAFAAAGRNKRFVALDLFNEEDRLIVDGLGDEADIIISALRPSVATRIGVDGPTLRRRYPSAVVLEMSAFGSQPGALDTGAHDISIRAAAGLLPIRSLSQEDLEGAPMADVVTGLYGAIAALAGIVARGREGRSPALAVSMLDAAYAANQIELTRVLQGRPDTEGLRAPAGYGTYETRDGRILAIAIAHEAHYWTALCRVLGLSDWSEANGDERINNREEIEAELGEALLTRDSTELEKALLAAAIPFDWLLTPSSAAARAEVGGMVVTDPQGVKHLASPILVNGNRLPVRRGFVEVGEDNAEIRARQDLDRFGEKRRSRS